MSVCGGAEDRRINEVKRLHCHTRGKWSIFGRDAKQSQKWKLPLVVTVDSRWSKEFGMPGRLYHPKIQRWGGQMTHQHLCKRLRLFASLYNQEGITTGIGSSREDESLEGWYDGDIKCQCLSGSTVALLLGYIEIDKFVSRTTAWDPSCAPSFSNGIKAMMKTKKRHQLTA